MQVTDFASILCSRLCHDLVSPAGALSTGLELLQDEPDDAMREQCLDLLGSSARQITNRLKFFRMAFGAGAGLADSVDVRELQAALNGWFDADKVQVHWMMETDLLPKTAAKLLLNLALLAGESLLRGGVLHVAAQRGETTLELAIRAEGPRLRFHEDVHAVLTRDPSAMAVEPRTAPAFLVRMLSHDAGATLAADSATDGVLVIGLALPTA
ncbi:MAG: histidine phosphotransferase [Sphingomonadales bacterium]|nr:MAG: histidine phosphotransferase [Sphingomonadales bacterium]